MTAPVDLPADLPDLPKLHLPELFTDADGLARWRTHRLPLDQGSLAAALSAPAAAQLMQWRASPVGFASDFHCTGQPQWLIVLQGVMEIGLRDGSWRRFGPGQCFYSNDTLPPGQSFDPARHGHRSRQAGPQPLHTLFVRAPLHAALPG
ncbi:MAG: hypothetical protein ACTTJV_05025 [Ottowia sp.]